MLTQDDLKAHLKYASDTGVWTWEVDIHCGRGKGRVQIVAGTEAGCMRVCSKGRTRHKRRTIDLHGKRYPAARLAWLYMTGKWPALEIDHQDRNPANERWSNLREVTRKQNNENRRNSNNTSGFRGVYWRRDVGKWAAQIGHEYRTIPLGAYESLLDAAAARIRAERLYFTHSERCAS